jgi:hypothetical protein
MLHKVCLLAAAIAKVGADADAESTSRNLLFSNAQASLPDVVLSESVVYVNEGGSFMYTVQLSHKPGVREDNSVDLANDEVRLYLTSSQEVYQQGTGTSTGSETFTSMLGHRTQLQIDTNVAKCETALNSVMGRYTTAACHDASYNPATPSGLLAGICRNADDNDGTYSSETDKATCIAAGKVWEPTAMHYELPLPVVFVAYSTQNPTQASLQTTAGTYDKVCPLCTHPKYCRQGTAGEIIAFSNKDNGATGGTDTPGFDGCLTATYLGFAPVKIACQAGAGTATPPGATTGGLTDLTTPGTAISYCQNLKAAGAADKFDGISYFRSGQRIPLVVASPMGVGKLPAGGSAIKTDADELLNSAVADTSDKLGKAATATDKTNEAVTAASILTTGTGTGLALKYTTASNAVSSITVTAGGSGYKVGDSVIVLNTAMDGRSTDFVMTLVSGDVEANAFTGKLTDGGKDLFENEGDNAVLGWLPGDSTGGVTNGQGALGSVTTFSANHVANNAGDAPGSGADYARMVGKSDYRMTADGGRVRRKITKDDTKCRYCAAPGLRCEDALDSLCAPVEISGGDTAAGYCVVPSISAIALTNGAVTETVGSEKFALETAHKVRLAGFMAGDVVEITGSNCATAKLKPGAPLSYMIKSINGANLEVPGQTVLASTPAQCSISRPQQRSGTYLSKYACEEAGFTWDATNWRGDLSSGAQLVFDSSNWNIPQTVTVTARDDDVYEPMVFRRGQDAYVHHYVVAQDVNLQHTYYDDIDVNALTVSITDDDAAVVLQRSSSLTPTEAKTFLEVESAGCRDPTITEYNKCIKASSCMGACVENSYTVSDTMGTETLVAGALIAARGNLVSGSTIDVTDATAALFTVGDSLIVSALNSQACGGAGAYVVASITGASGAKQIGTTSALSGTGTAANCLISRACPVLSKNQAACVATTANANLAKCYTDATGTAEVAATAADIDTRAECQGTHTTSKHGVTGTCEGWAPDSTDSTKSAAQLACLKKGSDCATKADCDSAGHTWTPKGYVFIGDQDTGSNSAYIWAANTWSAGADEIKVRLSSEPMYDTTLYVQSGLFFPDGATPSATNMDADDEQLIFQDMGQYSTCYSNADLVLDASGLTRASFRFDVASGGGALNSGDRVQITTNGAGCNNGIPGWYTVDSATGTQITLTQKDSAGSTITQFGTNDPGDATKCRLTRHKGSAVPCPSTPKVASKNGCDAHGHFVTGQSYNDQSVYSPHQLPTQAHDQASCALLEQSACEGARASGCVWGKPLILTANALGDAAGNAPNDKAQTGMLTSQTKVVTPTGGSGTGATLSITFNAGGNDISDITAVTGGGGYKVGDQLVVQAADIAAASSARTSDLYLILTSADLSATGKCVHTGTQTATKAKDLMCAAANKAIAATETEANCKTLASQGCMWNGVSCAGADLGYDCNSFLTFSSTNWHTWQTLKVIATPDDEDETETLALSSTVYEGSVTPSYGVKESKIGFMVSSADWYYTADGVQYLENAKDTTTAGKLVTTLNALKSSITTDTVSLKQGVLYDIPTTTSGSGQGARLTIEQSAADAASGRPVTGISVANPGSGYAVGDTLTVAAAHLSGNNADLVVTLAADDIAKVGMFDTRYGDAINRFPAIYGGNAAADAYRSSTPTIITVIEGSTSASSNDGKFTLTGGAAATAGFVKGDKVLVQQNPASNTACTAAGRLKDGSTSTGPVYTVQSVGTGGDAGKLVVDGDLWIGANAGAGSELSAAYGSGGHCQLIPLRCASPTLGMGETYGRTQPSYGCVVTKPFSTTVAKNQVCLDKAGHFNSPSAHQSRQVTKFEPSKYATDGITCGATSYTQDVNLRGVVISRSKCEATEGRRFYHVDITSSKRAMTRPYNPKASNGAALTRTGLFLDDSAKTAASSPTKVASALMARVALSTGASLGKITATGVSSAAKTFSVASGGSQFAPGDPVYISDAGSCNNGAAGYYTVASVASNVITMTTAIGSNDPGTPTDCKIEFAFTTDTSAAPAASGFSSVKPTDYWTSRNVLNEASLAATSGKTMSMPTCPFTIGLTSAPAENKYVVVVVHEDATTAELRDNELYFYEEPTFRDIDMDGVMNWVADDGTACTHAQLSAAGRTRSCADACDLRFPGSVGIIGSDVEAAGSADATSRCFIKNVPCTGTAGSGNCVAAKSAVTLTAGTTASVSVASTTTGLRSGDRVVVSAISGQTGCDGGMPGTYTVDYIHLTATAAAAGTAAAGSTTIVMKETVKTGTITDVTKCEISRPATTFVPNGGKKIDVKFTDKDWNVPRRMTVIALNDDVDEPHEERKVFFTMAYDSTGTYVGSASSPGSDDPIYRDASRGTPGTTGTGIMAAAPFNSNPILPVYSGYQSGTDGNTHSDAFPSKATGLSPGQWSPPTTTGNSPYIVATQITVTVVDDDIADLVVLCGQNAVPGTVSAATDAATTRAPSQGTATVATTGTAGTVAASPTLAAISGTTKGAVSTGSGEGFGMGSTSALGFIGSYDDGLSNVEANKIVGLDADGDTHLSRAGYSAEDGIAYAGELSFGGGEASGTTDTTAAVAAAAAQANGVVSASNLFKIDSANVAIFPGDRVKVTATPANNDCDNGIPGFYTVISTAEVSSKTELTLDRALGTADPTDPTKCRVERLVGDKGGACRAYGLTTGQLGSCGPQKGLRPELSASVLALAGDQGAGAAPAGKFVAGTSWKVAGFVVDDIVLVQTKPGGGGACAAAGYYTVTSIAGSGLVDLGVAEDVAAYTAADCMLSRPSGYDSGVTLTAADRDIASPKSAVGAACSPGDTRCYPDTSVPWKAYDPYTDKYYTTTLSGVGAAAVNAAAGGAAAGAAAGADFIGTPKALSNANGASITAGAAGSGKFVLGSAAAVAGFAAGDKLLVTGTAAGCTIDGAYTVKSVQSSASEYSLTVEELVGTCDNTCGSACTLVMADAATSGQIRGFKGLGPATTEARDEYACTVHTRECTKTTAGFCYTVSTNAKDSGYTTESTCIAVADKAWGYWTDSEGKACEKANVGSFQIRLNSSPGQKSVKRQYLGEASTVIEKELVHIVVTPDATAQTQFEPASVTFTENGGLIDGKPTQKWDSPATIDVRPVDDSVDERQGVTVDFTAFSIRQSHETDEYWTYTTTYQNKPAADESAEVGYCKDTVLTCTAATCGVGVTSVDNSAKTITVADASVFSVGDPVHLKAKSGAACASASGNGPSNNLAVKTITGNVITLTQDAGCGHNTQAKVTACGSATAAGTTAEAGGYASGDCVLYRGGKAACGSSSWVDYPSTGTAHTWNSASTFRATDSTPYRHTIRTIHTKDNDFAGVTVSSGMADAASCDGKTSSNQATCSAIVGEAACVLTAASNSGEGGTPICKWTPGSATTTGRLMGGATWGSGAALHGKSNMAVTGSNANGDDKLIISTVTHAQKKFTFANTGANKVMPTGSIGPTFEVGDIVVVESINSCTGTEAATDGTGCCAARGTYTVASVDQGSGTGFITVKETVLAEPNADAQCKISRPAVKAGDAGDGVSISVTEGGTFAYYTLKLDSQPAKIQRQAGTNPNEDYQFNPTSTDDVDGVVGGSADTNDGAANGDFFGDYTKKMRPATAHPVPTAGATGSVEPPEQYWVDVTATQTIHLDLAEPASCPPDATGANSAPWGGGKAVPTAEHPRFPFNGRDYGSGTVTAYDEVNTLNVGIHPMNKYLPTCGGWQRDATHRFTASNWNIPQFVYLYAHNDADGPRPGGHVGAVVVPISAQTVTTITAGAAGAGSFAANGLSGVSKGDTLVVTSTNGNVCDAAGTYTVRAAITGSGPYTVPVAQVVLTDTAGHCQIARPAYPGNNAAAGGSETTDSGRTHYSTTIKHYVETEDTMDNMKRTAGQGGGFVQRSKHGGIYTWGNLERYPFGRVVSTDSQNAHQNLHETGFTTYGYTSYESLYGYKQPADGAKCTRADMGADYTAVAAATPNADATMTGKKLTINFAADAAPAVAVGDVILVAASGGTCTITGTYTVHQRTGATVVVVEPGPAALGASGNSGVNCRVSRPVGLYSTFSGAQVKADAAESTYRQTCTDIDTGKPTPYLDEAATAQAGASGGGDICVPMASSTLECQPFFAEDNDVATAGVQNGRPTGAGTALYQPPKDVTVRVTDNDVIAEQATASVAGCRATQLFQFAQSVGDSVGQQTSAVAGDGVFKKQWLTDYNCKSGDAGGLPGYPVEVAAGVNGEPATSFDGYCTDSTKTNQAACEASKYCTVKGICTFSGSVFKARQQSECGVCIGIGSHGGSSLQEGSNQARLTKAECEKDVDGDGNADGVWTFTGTGTTYTWSVNTGGTGGATDCATAGRLGYTLTSAAGDQLGSLKSHVWVPRPLGDGAMSAAWMTQSTASSVTDGGDANLQCCSCVAAYGSGLLDSAFANFQSKSECTTRDSSKAREGGQWKCSGAGPYCTAAPGFIGSCTAGVTGFTCA